MEHEEIFDIEYYMAHEDGGMAEYHKLTFIERLFKFNDTFVKQIEPVCLNMVCTQISYYQDTLSVKEKGNYLKHGGTEIGIWEKFDKRGLLVETENMDEHFPISWYQLEKILKDKDISLLTADSIFRYYDKDNDEATWSIVIKLPMEKGCLYVFDARTGGLIDESIIDMMKER